MCGISVIISKGKVKINNLIDMTNIIRHRGPDDEGFALFSINESKVSILGSRDTLDPVWDEGFKYKPLGLISNTDETFNIAFGHRRLSILDLSASGHMPMCNENGRYWITYNGEIYNYIELKSELKELGHEFSTNTDTEVILKSYIQWGATCLNRFNGMWAFGIYDSISKNLFLARDRFGIKPLYYWVSPKEDLYFGSEIKQFTVCDGWKPLANSQRVYDYLFYAMTDHTDETMFKGVYHIPPGCYADFNVENYKVESENRLNYSRWYFPENVKYQGSFNSAKYEFNKLFKSAIDLHLRADVKTGTALSGGLDSSAIVCYISQRLKLQGLSDNLMTFSSCSHDIRFDEKAWMDIVVKHTDVDPLFIYPDGDDIFNISEKIVWHQDEPYQSQSVFLGYKVFESASINNVKVLLNGQGADEYLSGYSAFESFRRLKLLKAFKLKQLFNELRGFSTIEKFNLISKSSYHLLPRSLSRFFSYKRKGYKRLEEIIDLKKLSAKKEHPYDSIPYGHDSIFNIAYHQLMHEPLQKYLRWEDRNSMAHSVEARVPFLDYRLVEFSANMPVEYLDAFGEKKKLLRHSLKDLLPEEIFTRSDKKGFITPEQKWFLEDKFNDYIRLLNNYLQYSDSIIRKDAVIQYFNDIKNGFVPFDYTYWRLISLGMWMKVFNVRLDNS